ncbi:MAG: hypothetical protein L3J46_08435 [Kangiellaceae bacterium]|nr:hypothetical protein [Kangiellaceae bacterium]
MQAAIAAAGLTKYAGGFAPKKTGTSPWVTNIDLSIIQEVPGLFDGHKGQLSFIFDNFLNFIDDDKGVVIDNRFGSKRLYDVDSVDAQGRYVIDGVRDDQNRFNAEQSTWKLKIGLRYSF